MLIEIASRQVEPGGFSRLPQSELARVTGLSVARTSQLVADATSRGWLLTEVHGPAGRLYRIRLDAIEGARP